MPPPSREYRFTDNFGQMILRRRPYLTREWCIRVVEDPIRIEQQPEGRIRFWGSIPELRGRYLRVVTLADGLTIHNAFPDRRFKP
jgi:hypothetical protein